MQRQAATAALTVLVWTLLCPGTLSAKPTRTLTRPPARLVAAAPRHRSSLDRAAPKAARVAAHPDARRGAHAAAKPAPVPRRKASARDFLEAARPADAAIARRARTRAQQAAAARDAILAANRAASNPNRLPSDGAATGDEPAANIAALPPIRPFDEQALTPVLPSSLRVSSLFDGHGRLIVPPPLYGSREILLHQNLMADREGLDRVQDDAGLLDLLRDKKLVALPTNEALRVDDRLPENRRYSRPWTATFLAIMAHDYYAAFHTPLQVNSAVRTVAFQQRLLRVNGNAASAAGEEASPHLTGQAVDIAKHGLSLTQIAWMRAYLSPLIDQGKIDVEEEFQQACFHISVYKNYLPAVPHVTVAATRQPSTESLSERPSY
jgi:hypothetical protein